MDRQEIDNKLRKLIELQLNVRPDQITTSATLITDLGCDSLDLVELLMAIEDDFKDQIGGPIPDNVVDNFKTYGQVLDYVASGGKTEPDPSVSTCS